MASYGSMVDNRGYKKFVFILIAIFAVVAFVNFVLRPPTTQSASETIDAPWTSCKHVSVAELDQWSQSTEWQHIPKIIHQTWKNETLRERQAQWSQTWCQQYTDWRYHLWTDEENDRFVRSKFPWFYPTYETLSPAILRADSVRYMYMHYYGGIYLDLDYESIRRVDPLLKNKVVVLALLNYGFNSQNSVPNSWMASRPNHPLWTYILYRIMFLWSRVVQKERIEFHNGKAEFFTGPQALYEGLMFYLQLVRHSNQSLNQLFGDHQNQTAEAVLEVADVTFLGPKYMNAYDWMSGVGRDVCSAEMATFDEKKCKELLKPLYGITYWSHSYGHGHESDTNYLQKKAAQ